MHLKCSTLGQKELHPSPFLRFLFKYEIIFLISYLFAIYSSVSNDWITAMLTNCHPTWERWEKSDLSKMCGVYNLIEQWIIFTVKLIIIWTIIDLFKLFSDICVIAPLPNFHVKKHIDSYFSLLYRNAQLIFLFN